MLRVIHLYLHGSGSCFHIGIEIQPTKRISGVKCDKGEGERGFFISSLLEVCPTFVKLCYCKWRIIQGAGPLIHPQTEAFCANDTFLSVSNCGAFTGSHTPCSFLQVQILSAWKIDLRRHKGSTKIQIILSPCISCFFQI